MSTPDTSPRRAALRGAAHAAVITVVCVGVALLTWIPLDPPPHIKAAGIAADGLILLVVARMARDHARETSWGLRIAAALLILSATAWLVYAAR
jgi:hypothetical protein